MVDALTLAEAPKIRLGGCDWAVPELAAKQIMRLVPALGRLERLGRAKAGGFETLTEEEIKWIYDVAFIALTRAYPDLARESFDDLPIRIDEIVAAMPVIARQAGLKRRSEPESEAAPAGEA
jgi:hypothetical protein